MTALTKTSRTGVFKWILDSNGQLDASGHLPESSWIAVDASLLGLTDNTNITAASIAVRLFGSNDGDESSSAAAIQTLNEKIAAGKSPISNTITFTGPDDEQIWLECVLSLEFDASGTPICVNGVIRDISKERIAEENLRELGDHLSRILAEVPIGIFRMDFSATNSELLSRAHVGGNWMINSSLLYGLPNGALKSPLETSQYILEDDAEHVSQAFSEAAAKGLTRYEVEYRTIWPDGSLHWLSSKALLDRDADGNITAINGIQFDITERKLQQERIEFMAGHDVLTDLPNRALCMETMARTVAAAKRYGRSFAVMYIDLDRFKMINDTLGHDAGDKLLIEIARRFTSVLRASEFIARLGGDEFIVIADGIETAAQAGVVAEKLVNAAIAPMMLVGQECRVTASVGISVYPQDASDEHTLMKNADLALYTAKEKGKNTFQFYSQEMASQSVEHLDLDVQLRKALEHNEFTLQYQPKVNLQSNAITGVEALLRWDNEKLGSVSPVRFIPVAEESGLIVPIGKWVLNTACQQAASWQKAGIDIVPIAVNVSPRQFAENQFYNDVVGALDSSGLSPHLLELELTEGMIMRDIDRAVALLTELKALGVRVAIDDFGTGYSSLAQIRRFPIDTLKVDRAFVRNIQHDAEGQAIAAAIFNMAKNLSLTVIAEGVETGDEAQFLRDSTCDEMQGYYFSRPISGEDFSALLTSHSATKK